MAADPETPPPATAPNASEGVLQRLATKFGIKSESDVVAELKTENSALLAAANDAQAELELSKAETARQGSVIAGLNARISAVDAAVPGLSAATDPAAHVTQAITARVVEQAASAAIPEASLPVNAPNAVESNLTLDQQFAALKTPAEKAAFIKENGKAALK